MNIGVTERRRIENSMTKVSKEENKTIRKIFPLINRIEDKEIATKVVRACVRIWRESGHKDLREAPTTHIPLASNETLVQHTNASARAALALATEFEAEYGTKVNFDVLLASAICHDLDKALSIEKAESGWRVSEFGEKFPHGSYSMHVALDEGLPLEVAHIIVTHSPQSSMQPHTIEGMLFQKAEQGMGRAHLISMGMSPPYR